MATVDLDITIGKDSQGLIFASVANDNTFTSLGYSETPVTDPQLAFTTDLVENNNESVTNTYYTSISRATLSDDPTITTGLGSLFYNNFNLKKVSCFFYADGYGGSSTNLLNFTALLSGDNYYFLLPQSYMSQEKVPNTDSTKFTFKDSSKNDIGSVTFNPTTNSFNATSTKSIYNYQMIFIIANCAMASNFYQGNPATDTINAMNAMAVSVFDKLT